ncbi:hypothetical protein F5Y15DRAFT_366391 [Xylariaceae sp. FL0016]|nr:hypothetical protein F5Y15DRAFT_366391 [Xylariaceae sp. FL0016]
MVAPHPLMLRLLAIALALPLTARAADDASSQSARNYLSPDEGAIAQDIKRQSLSDFFHEAREAMPFHEDIMIPQHIDGFNSPEPEKRSPKKRPSSSSNNNSTIDNDESSARRSAVTLPSSVALGLVLLVGFLQI